MILAAVSSGRSFLAISEPTKAELPLSAVEVIFSTLALSPACRGRSDGLHSSASRTGRRCTTLTQLPVAFSGGNSEKLSPVPGLRLITLP